jgi:hypothetical protein
MNRLGAAERVAAQRRSRLNFAKLSVGQLRILDAFMKEVVGLDGDARRSRWAEFLSGHEDIAAALSEGPGWRRDSVTDQTGGPLETTGGRCGASRQPDPRSALRTIE